VPVVENGTKTGIIVAFEIEIWQTVNSRNTGRNYVLMVGRHGETHGLANAQVGFETRPTRLVETNSIGRISPILHDHDQKRFKNIARQKPSSMTFQMGLTIHFVPHTSRRK
jgi:hypothetical protein